VLDIKRTPTHFKTTSQKKAQVPRRKRDLKNVHQQSAARPWRRVLVTRFGGIARVVVPEFCRDCGGDANDTQDHGSEQRLHHESPCANCERWEVYFQRYCEWFIKDSTSNGNIVCELLTRKFNSLIFGELWSVWEGLATRRKTLLLLDYSTNSLKQDLTLQIHLVKHHKPRQHINFERRGGRAMRVG
jgi:hypothetical protein